MKIWLRVDVKDVADGMVAVADECAIVARCRARTEEDRIDFCSRWLNVAITSNEALLMARRIPQEKSNIEQLERLAIVTV